ncbi:molybdenum cofactor guanylyltransferase [Leucobacter triazinivorans]|uniref:MobA-like NTP transferase domain-containing protein n=1 Tax=Leucobacter triazinivorans TaxID=1784719 RepID=A0A4P6KCS1_9MICO|nr:NTP transferase domain-containing protein [Leucobacter triazinivorans]QBE47933.1 hypothetical protein EVS81_03070 [Leucobacter triazinivorans]
MTGPDIDAVVLAGGRGRRMGGRDKAVLRLGGERLVDRAVAAARGAGARRIVVVGPAHAGTGGVVIVREDPPFTGPLAALAAALPHVRAEWMLLLSCDLVRPDAVCALLRAQLADARDEGGIVLRDDAGRDQWLAGVYRSAVLRERVDSLDGQLAHAPLRRLLDGLRLRSVAATGDTTADIDEPADLERAVEGGDGVSTRSARSTGDGGGNERSEPDPPQNPTRPADPERRRPT